MSNTDSFRRRSIRSVSRSAERSLNKTRNVIAHGTETETTTISDAPRPVRNIRDAAKGTETISGITDLASKTNLRDVTNGFPFFTAIIMIAMNAGIRTSVITVSDTESNPDGPNIPEI